MTSLPQSAFNCETYSLKKLEFRNDRAHTHPFGGSGGWQGIDGVANLAWLEFSIWMVGNFRAVGQAVPLEEAFVGKKVRVSCAICLKARRKRDP